MVNVVDLFGGRKTIVCAHCEGNGMCGRSSRVSLGDGLAVMRCDVCGDGVALRSGRENAPTCKVCKGTGYTWIDPPR